MAPQFSLLCTRVSRLPTALMLAAGRLGALLSTAGGYHDASTVSAGQLTLLGNSSSHAMKNFVMGGIQEHGDGLTSN